jgi:adenylylsulfate kinase-like enzyme
MASTASTSSTPTPESDGAKPKPSVIITIGMAGAGKSTFVQRLNSHLHAKNQPPYILNLDPAITHSIYEANIDIRDTVDYKQVMKQCVSCLHTRWLSYRAGIHRRCEAQV